MQPYSFRSIATVVLTLAAIAACRPAEQPEPDIAATSKPALVVVKETWISAYDESDNVDSVAVAHEAGLVIATSKSRHELLLIDTATGKTLDRVGGPGRGPGQFARPNGIAVIDDLVLVVERDNHRLQILRLPGFEPIGMVGEDILERPYGIAGHQNAEGHIEVWITDNFDLPSTDSDRLSERIRHFRIEADDGELQWDLISSFGELRGHGALHKVETIGFDPPRGLLVVAEESFDRMGLVIYNVDGTFSGAVVGSDVFEAEPEGVALWECDGGGLWIATDQPSTHSIFHLFERTDFAYFGAFRGEVTANTDGVAITRDAVNGFPHGAFFAVHDDGAVAAFDLAEIAGAVDLPCPAPPLEETDPRHSSSN